MKNNNTRELNFNFIERQPIATEAYLFFCLVRLTKKKLKKKCWKCIESFMKMMKVCNLLIMW